MKSDDRRQLSNGMVSLASTTGYDSISNSGILKNNNRYCP